MTREEAILILGEFKEFCDSILWDSIYAERSRAIDMAIYALMREQQFMYNASQGTTTILKIENRHFEVRERVI